MAFIIICRQLRSRLRRLRRSEDPFKANTYFCLWGVGHFPPPLSGLSVRGFLVFFWWVGWEGVLLSFPILTAAFGLGLF
jgi:hypothetical protein